MDSNNNRFIAFFDLLGFSNYVKDNSIESVLSVFSKIFKTIASSWYNQLVNASTALVLQGLWTGEARQQVSQHLEDLFNYIKDESKTSFRDFNDSTLNAIFPLKASILSDSILIYSDPITQPHQRLIGCEIITILARQFLRETFLSGIMVRGAVSFGEFYIDDLNSVYFGKGLVNAVELEKIQEWIGCCLDDGMVEVYREYHEAWAKDGKPPFWQKTNLGSVLTRNSIAMYPVPTKSNSTENRWIINWCGAIIGRVNIHDGFFDSVRTGHPPIDQKYDNTLQYLKWWKSELERLVGLDPSAVMEKITDGSEQIGTRSPISQDVSFPPRRYLD